MSVYAVIISLTLRKGIKEEIIRNLFLTAIIFIHEISGQILLSFLNYQNRYTLSPHFSLSYTKYFCAIISSLNLQYLPSCLCALQTGAMVTQYLAISRAALTGSPAVQSGKKHRIQKAYLFSGTSPYVPSAQT